MTFFSFPLFVPVGVDTKPFLPPARVRNPDLGTSLCHKNRRFDPKLVLAPSSLHKPDLGANLMFVRVNAKHKIMGIDPKPSWPLRG